MKDLLERINQSLSCNIHGFPVTVTVTKALVLRSLLEDRGCITESIRILVTVDRMEEKCFQITMKRVRRSQQFQLRRWPVPCSWCSNRDVFYRSENSSGVTVSERN